MGELGLLLVVLGFCFFVIGIALKLLRSPDTSPPQKRPVTVTETGVFVARTVRVINLTDACPICLCLYGEGVEISVLPCGHGLHDNCWKALAGPGAVCPLCREPVV
jgi:hypothetical protein